MTTPTLFHSIHFDDADAGLAFLRAIGFEERGVHRDPADPSVVVHAQLSWGGAGGVMCGSAQRSAPAAAGSYQRRVGVGSCYLVVPSDEAVDEVYEKALAAGGSSVMEPEDQDYGGRSATVRDAEGNQYSIGSYAGE
ncbi:bleomycin resistance protein [Arsenicicoccus piscis]|nr:VOC family protein [Arsenicicoccus piscis]MCH8627522.1 bleomycin resistance protein [Arsenicicoccus piscis]